MSLDLSNYEQSARAAVKWYWRTKQLAKEKKKALGTKDQGKRGEKTAGKHLDGFTNLFIDIIKANGLPEAAVFRDGKKALNLPGHFRPIKEWDLVVIQRDRLVAALEFKSMGSSFGNNLNNRSEEVLGVALDLWTTFRKGGLNDTEVQPFLGYLFLLEDHEAARKPVKITSAHFPALPEFEDASYADRLDILCRKMVKEKLYTAACALLINRKSADSGDYTELSAGSGLRNFVTTLAGHIAAEAMR